MDTRERVLTGGKLVSVPFATGDLRETVVNEYRKLLKEYQPEEVLVLAGSPTSIETFRSNLTEATSGANVPQVTSPIVHATDVINRSDVSDRTILSDALRYELVHRFLEDRDWNSEYLQRASEQDSFRDHVAALMETVAWQDVTPDETPELQEISQTVDEFHAWLDQNDHMERGQLIPEATALLEARETGVADIEAVLAVEFEEYFPADRGYLAALTDEDDVDLVCIAEENGSIRRTLIETGSVPDRSSFTDHERVSPEDSEPETCPSATAAYLSSGDVPGEPSDGNVTVLESETRNGQIEEVADEIERLVERDDWTYDDIAVALKGSGDLSDALNELHRSGIPTESTTVTGFGDDPAVRELLRVIQYLAGEEISVEDDPVLDEALLSRIETSGSLADALRSWATKSNLKTRVAEETSPLDARARFGNVRRVFRMAEFIEDSSFVAGTWTNLAQMVRRAHGYSPQRNQTSATERDGGVLVDRVSSIKNGEFRAVFLLDIVDPRYPGRPQLTPLFPTERVSEMPDYPGVTQVDETDLGETFPNSTSTESIRPFRAYHTGHARRTLAVGADTATDRLYLCIYDYEGNALENRVQPSRFLVDMYRSLPWMEETDDSIIRDERAAEEYLLSRVDKALADVRRANTQDVEVPLEELKSELVEVSRLLDESGERGEELRDALLARIDFAEGRVQRD